MNALTEHVAAAFVVAGAAVSMALDAPAAEPDVPRTARVVADDLVWGRFDIGAGGHIDQVVVHPTVPGLIYARSDVGGVYRRDPGSDRFINVTDNLDHQLLADEANQNLLGADAIAVSAQDPDLLLAHLGRYTNLGDLPAGVYRSTDRGETWAEVLDVPAGGNMVARDRSSSIAVDPIDGRYVYLGTRKDGLFRSTDAGLTWTKVDAVPVGWGSGNGRDAHIGIRNVILRPDHAVDGRSGTIYVNPEREGIWHSTDGGENWSRLRDSPGTVQAWAFDDAGETLFISADDVRPKEDAVLALDAATGAFTEITPRGGSVTGYKTDRYDAKRFGGIGFEAGSGVLILNDSDSNNHVLTSLDRGQTWRWHNWSKAEDAVVQQEPWRAESWTHQNAYSYVDDPHHPGMLWKSDVFNAWTIDLSEVPSGGPLRIDSQGKGLENTSALSLAAPPGEDVLIYLGTQDVSGFTFRSLDEPATERYSAKSRMRNHNTTSIAYSFDQPQHLAIAAQWSWLAVSDDGGQTMRALDKPSRGQRPVLAMDSADPLRMVLSGVGSVYHTADGGQTWQQGQGLPGYVWGINQKYGNLQTVAADKVQPGTFYVYQAGSEGDADTGGTMLVTTDGGATWSSSATMPSRRAKFGLQVKTPPQQAGNVWVSLANRGLWRSRDAGASMQPVEGFEHVTAYGFGKPAPGAQDPAVYVFGQYDSDWGVYQSTDDGQAWRRIDDPRWPALARLVQIEGDLDDYGQIYLGFGGQGTAYLDIDPADAEN